MRHLLITILIFNSTFTLYSQDTISRYPKLIYGKDTLYIDDILNKTICSRIESDSVIENIEFSNVVLLKDTALVQPNSYDFYSYKRNLRKNSTIHFGQGTKERMKIPLNNIYYLKKERAGLKLVSGSAIFCSLISGIIVAPLVSIGKPFKTERFRSIANPSLAIFVTALTINIVWGDKYYYIQKHKHNKIWKIE